MLSSTLKKHNDDSVPIPFLPTLAALILQLLFKNFNPVTDGNRSPGLNVEQATNICRYDSIGLTAFQCVYFSFNNRSDNSGCINE